jgi:hypothetical protein
LDAQAALDEWLGGLRPDAADAAAGEATIASSLALFSPAPCKAFIGVPSQVSKHITLPLSRSSTPPFLLQLFKLIL